MTASDTESDWSQEVDVIADLDQKIALEEDDQALKMKGSSSTALMDQIKRKSAFKNAPTKQALPEICHEIQAAFPDSFIPRIFSMSLLLNCRRRPRNTQTESARWIKFHMGSNKRKSQDGDIV